VVVDVDPSSEEDVLARLQHLLILLQALVVLSHVELLQVVAVARAASMTASIAAHHGERRLAVADVEV